MDLEAALSGLAPLADPVRRSLYRFVVERHRPTGRKEAAEAVGISRRLAAYHLDRLVEEGFLEVEYRRLGNRSGPGAGRSSKLYRRAARQVDLSLPPRSYRVAGEILVEALARGPDRTLLEDTARRHGRRAGEKGLEEALAGTGYEPVEGDDEVRFANCPFDALRQVDRQLTCSMNLAFVEGLLEGAHRRELQAVLAPEEGSCCVRLRRAPGDGGGTPEAPGAHR